MEAVVSQRLLPIPELRGATFQIQETFFSPSPKVLGRMAPHCTAAASSTRDSSQGFAGTDTHSN